MGIVKRCILEDQATKITMSCNDVIRFLFLTKAIANIRRLIFCSFTNQRGSYQRTVHSREQRTTKYTCYTHHMKWVHQNVVFSLKHDHKVKCTGDTKRYTIGKRALTNWINQEYRSRSRNRCRISDCNPRTYS